jgi:hypothetical protein
MTGASVHLVRLLVTMVLLSVGSATAVLAGCLSATVDYESPDEEEKTIFRLTFEQTEMLGRFGNASFDYPKLSFKEVARKLLGPKPFKATMKGVGGELLKSCGNRRLV